MEQAELIKLNTRTTFFFMALTGLSQTAVAEEAVSPECRGVAAGVVAAMRSAGELPDQVATEVAVVAARRACMAARNDLGSAPLSSAAGPAAAAAAPAETPEKKMSIWDILSSDQDPKPGNERLKSLRQQ